MMEPGQSCVLYIITLPGLHCVSVWSGMPNEASEPIWVARPTDGRLRSPAKLTWTASPLLVTQWCSTAPYVSSCWLNQRKVGCNTGMVRKRARQVQDINSQSERSWTVPNGVPLASSLCMCGVLPYMLFYLKSQSYIWYCIGLYDNLPQSAL